MSEDRISMHEVRLVQTFQSDPSKWLTNGELAEVAQMSARTARAHTARLTELGLLEVEKVFPANKYRLRPELGEAALEYLERYEKAREVFGL